MSFLQIQFSRHNCALNQKGTRWGTQHVAFFRESDRNLENKSLLWTASLLASGPSITTNLLYDLEMGDLML